MMSVNQDEMNLTVKQKLKRIPFCEQFFVFGIVVLVFGLIITIGCFIASSLLKGIEDDFTSSTCFFDSFITNPLEKNVFSFYNTYTISYDDLRGVRITDTYLDNTPFGSEEAAQAGGMDMIHKEHPCFIPKPVPIRLEIVNTTIADVFFGLGIGFAALGFAVPLIYLLVQFRMMYKKKE